MSVATLVPWLLISCVVSHEIRDPLESSNLRGRLARSVGGFDASIERYPYMASIRVAGRHWCGGSILSADVILTAAHCIPEDLFLDIFDVKVGSADIKYKGSWHPVVKVIKHEEHNKQELLEDGSRVVVNDIALLKLGEPIDIDNKTTRTIELFKEDDNVHKYSTGILSGWGDIPAIVNKTVPNPKGNGTITRKKKTSRSPASLQFVELNIASEHKCSNLLPSANLDGQFCTFTFGKKSCGGDSGSPFIVDGRQAGIASWTHANCHEDLNTVSFTEVAKFKKWIDEKMKTL